MKYVLITGSAGLVGYESVKFFLNKGFKVLGIDNNSRKTFFGKTGSIFQNVKELKEKYKKKYIHYNIDIRNFKALKKIFSKYNKNIKLIIHAAGQPSHDWAYKDPFVDFKINAEGTLNLLELTKKFSSNSVFIFLSTNKVYGDNPNKLRILETKYRYELNKKNPLYKGINENFNIDNCIHSLFGSSKAYADLICQEYGKNLKLKTGIFRAGCITGPKHKGAKLHGFLSFLVKQIIKEKKYNIIGYKGKQVRDNIHSYDLVNCFWEFFKKPRYGEVYNIGGGRYSNCSILEAINYLEKKLNLKVKKIYTRNNRVGDHKWYISNISKFKKHYPKWKQKYNTSSIINEIIQNEKNEK
ncbi:MAG: NAD-dependent epimerase [Euryarchaeota archaeon]|nr:NAD-dependent epimerase [Euryarchaeota archaeon]|tara:strand:- start:2477 stop:3538 length:1062 start_codon:yes stop_codon:yes gene_type:complete